MSLRKAKLLLDKKKQAQTQQVVDQESQEQPVKKKTIGFSAFGNDFNKIDDSDSEEEQPIEIQNDKKQKEEPQIQKKKKKKKKKTKSKVINEDDEEDKEVKEVEAALKELNYNTQAKNNQTKQQENEEWAFILDINQSKFNYQKELRRHFKGWEPQKGQGDPDRTKKQQKMQKHLKKMMKKSVLSPGIAQYFPIRQKFQMLKQDDAVQFSASKKYDSLQKQYDIIKNTNDINALFQFSQMNPQHVDSLYSVGQFLRLQGNYRDADNLIQRVIYIYEMAGGYELGQFIKQPFIKKYIVYDQISTSFFMSIFKFIDILGKKGCFRSALEYNKFLLKINVNDPTACLLSIDFNALSSKQYTYLIDFTHNFSDYIGCKHQSLYLMPNFCYSVALARMLELSEPKKEGELVVQQNKLQNYLEYTQEHWQKALILPTKDSFVDQDPRILILRAIMIYPKLIIDIAAKNEFSKQFVNHPIYQGWQKKPFNQLMQHQFWTYVPVSYSYYFLKLDTVQDSQGLDKVLQVYVQRSKILWKSNNVLLWIKGALGMVLNKIDDKFNYQQHLQSLCLEQTNGVEIPFQLSRYSNINKNNFSDRVQRIDLNAIQDNQQQIRPQGQPLNMNQNPFSLFLNSLMPWVNIPGAQQPGQDIDMPFIEEDN